MKKKEIYTILLLHQKQKGMCIMSQKLETKTTTELLSTFYAPNEMLVDVIIIPEILLCFDRDSN